MSYQSIETILNPNNEYNFSNVNIFIKDLMAAYYPDKKKSDKDWDNHNDFCQERLFIPNYQFNFLHTDKESVLEVLNLPGLIIYEKQIPISALPTTKQPKTRDLILVQGFYKHLCKKNEEWVKHFLSKEILSQDSKSQHAWYDFINKEIYAYSYGFYF